MLPVLQHAVTKGYEFCFEDASKVIATLVYFDSDNKNEIESSMWYLFAAILKTVGGEKGSSEGGPAFEHIHQAVLTLQIYIASDPLTFAASPVDSGTQLSYVQMTMVFVDNIFKMQ